MKPAPFAFERARDLGEALELISSADGEARALAGGQSLMPMLNLRLAQPDLLVDIRPIELLKQITYSDQSCRVGACITTAQIEDGIVDGVTGRYLAAVAGGIAYRGIRNQGTIGGGVAHADPSADWPVALLALASSVAIAGPAEQRLVPMVEFFRSAFASSLADDELLTELVLPALSERAQWGYYKVAPKLGEFAEAIGAAVHDTDTYHCAVAIGATDSVPLRIAALEERWRDDPTRFPTLVGLTEIRTAITARGLAFDPYKLQCLCVAVKRAMVAATNP